MRILYLTRTKPHLINGRIRNVKDYVAISQSIDGFYNAFLRHGCNVVLDPREYYFLPPGVAYRLPKLYSVLEKIIAKSRLRKFDNYLLSKSIFKLTRKEHIDCIFSEIYTSLQNDFIEKLKKRGIQVTQWFGTFPNMVSPDVLSTLNHFSHIWCPGDLNEYFKQFNVKTDNFHYIGCSYNDRTMYHDYDPSFANDVVFIGSVGKHHSNRIAFLEAAANSFESFALYSTSIDNIPKKSILRTKYRGYANSEISRKVYSSSKIALNLVSKSYDRLKMGFNERLFQIPACRGALQAVIHNNNIYEYFSDEHLIMFKHIKELTNEINNILRNEAKRKLMVASAFKHNLGNSYYHRVKKILNILNAESKK